MDQIRDAASHVKFNNAQTTQVAGTLASAQMQPTGQYALSIFNSNQQYWMPGSTIFIPGTTTPMAAERLRGMVLHELLHNLGYDDTPMQVALGLERGPNTDNISEKLAEDCFGFRPPARP